MRGLLVRLYPAPWRARYEEEFVALLAERHLGPWDVADIVASAVDAHRRGRNQEDGPKVMDSSRLGGRRWGWAGMVGGLSWAAGLLSVTVDLSGRPWSVRTMFSMPPWPWPSVLLMMVGLAFLLIAVVGMGAVQARRRPGLAWASVAAIAAVAIAAVVSLAGIQVFGGRATLADAEALDIVWSVWAFAAVGVGLASGLFAAATLPSEPKSRNACVILIAGSVLATVTMICGATLGAVGPVRVSWWLGGFYVGVVTLAVGWVALGWTHTRGLEAGLGQVAPTSG